MKTWLFWVLLPAIASAAAVANRDELRAELIRTESRFFDYAFEHGFGEALREFMTEGAFIANSLTLGRAAQEAKVKAEQGRPRPNVIRWKPLRAEVSDSGDLGYTWGVAESARTREGPFRPYGIYVTIWKRQPDGRWKFVYDSATIVDGARIDAFVREHFPAAQPAPGRGAH
jgi:ketosteroid isomerase-like protein